MTSDAALARRFDALLAEGEAVPVDGWDFSWFDGRATEERPPWGYLRMLGERMAAASVALDIATGGGEVLAKIPNPPKVLVATESWPPNVPIAQRNLAPLGASVVQTEGEGQLPFADASFDLVVNRHAAAMSWHEAARVLKPGGTFFSQQIGAGTNRELAEVFVGPRPPREDQRAENAAAAARAAGLDVVDLREASPRVTFDDIAAVVVFLRKVIWTVPDFTVNRYRDQLWRLHQRIETEGPFVSHARRFLIEARKADRARQGGGAAGAPSGR